MQQRSGTMTAAGAAEEIPPGPGALESREKRLVCLLPDADAPHNRSVISERVKATGREQGGCNLPCSICAAKKEAQRFHTVLRG